jgi:4-diphosphocytidyl-2-C-methyl-D-erythritol kinase
VSHTPEKKDTFTLSGIDTGGIPEDNLILKAISRLREEHDFPYLKIHLHKAIPVGAGLGGGSSDASTLLKSVNRTFSLNIIPDDLKSMALELGSDCPFFIDGTPSFATGRGELLVPVSNFLSEYYLLLLNPGIRINTKEAYKNCHPAPPSESLLKLINKPAEQWKDLIKNDFEDYAFKKHPKIAQLKKDLYKSGAIFSSMSGSGSSVYGIYRERPRVTGKLKEFLIWEGTM